MLKKINLAFLIIIFLNFTLFTSACYLKVQNHPGHQEENLILATGPTIDENTINNPFTEEEILSNEAQTNEIVFVGIILVVIIFAGTFIFSWRNRIGSPPPA